MKKFILFLLLTTTFFLVACEQPHEHKFMDGYETTLTQHISKCECGETKVENHTFNE